MSVTYKPLAVFHSSHQETYEAPRQGVLAENATGWFEVDKVYGAESLEDLRGFEHIWLIYDFHKNKSWKPKVRPPRFSEKKRSVFSTRSPYRPNSIGMSCVKLDKIEGCKIFVSRHDLLEGSLILDIKPYIPYADSFPESATGWIKKEAGFEVQFEDHALLKIDWLEKNTKVGFKQILLNQLAFEPTNSKAKRVKKTDKGFVFSVRTWRFEFSINEKTVAVLTVYSGYSESEIADAADLNKDKSIHKLFLAKFTQTQTLPKDF